MKDIHIYQEQLEKEKTHLEKELFSVGRRNPSNKMDWEAMPQETGKEPDKGDAADLIEGYEENTGILKELETRYNKVLLALENISKGTYGVCRVCGETITKERLDADNAADVCKEHLNN